MHIITASDNNYAIGVLALVASAFRFNPQARFTVLITHWTPENLKRLRDLQARLGCRIDEIEMTAARLAQFSVTRDHLTAVTYARLFIPELIEDEGRVIYMDCDMLVTGSLQAAQDCILGDKLVAAVRCPSPTKSFCQAIDVAPENYFNAGFLVMNLALWRQEGVAQACFAALADPNCRYLSEDESAVNDAARGRVAYLSAGLNFYARDHKHQAAIDDPEGISVIHYASGVKPWMGPCPFDQVWLSLISQMPELAGFVQPKPSLNRRLSAWNKMRKIYIGAGLGREKYLKQRASYQYLTRTVVPDLISRISA